MTTSREYWESLCLEVVGQSSFEIPRTPNGHDRTSIASHDALLMIGGGATRMRIGVGFFSLVDFELRWRSCFACVC